MRKNVLVIGQGGREHAIAWKLAQSKHVEKVFVVPGNPGMNNAKIKAVNLVSSEFLSLVNFAKEKNVAFTIVGPENELFLGIVDFFQAYNLAIFGPSKYCAQLETSKSFCKKLLTENNIPTAQYKVFDQYQEAFDYLNKETNYPLVIKADGLAAGKGVTVCRNKTIAQKILKNIFVDNKFNFSKPKVVIEAFLQGQEFSQLAFVHNQKIAFMPIVQDYKTAFNNNKGPNTGGMGAHLPVYAIDKNLIEEGQAIISKIVKKLAELKQPYSGILYAGLMATKQGVQVIEFNVRFGDPETELLMHALKSDLFEIIEAFLEDKSTLIEWENSNNYVGVVLTAKGYPEAYVKEIPIAQNSLEVGDFFYMGVTYKNENLVSSGGRVLIVIGIGPSQAIARHNAYRKLEKFAHPKLIFREDIAKIKKETSCKQF